MSVILLICMCYTVVNAQDTPVQDAKKVEPLKSDTNSEKDKEVSDDKVNITVNTTSVNTTLVKTTAKPAVHTTVDNPHDDLPEIDGSDKEKQYSITIFFILLIIGEKICLFHYLFV